MSKNAKPEKRSSRPKSMRNRMKKLLDARNTLLQSSPDFNSLFSFQSLMSLPPFSSSFQFVVFFIQKFILDPCSKPSELPLNFCSHLFVGSSQVFRLLSKSITPIHLHAVYFTSSHRRRGHLAENFYYYKYNNLHRGFAIRSTVLPFLVAAVDFLEEFDDPTTQGKRYRLIEIKSAETTPPLKRILEGKKRQISLQIQSAMGIFGISETRLVLVKANDYKKQNFEIYASDIHQYTGLLEEDCERLIHGYVKCILAKYLKTYFKISLTSNESKKLIQIFLEHAQASARINRPFDFDKVRDNNLSFEKYRRECVESFKDKFKFTYKSS